MIIVFLSVGLAPAVDVALLYSKQLQGGGVRPQWARGLLHVVGGLCHHPGTCRTAWRRHHGGGEAREADAWMGPLALLPA